MAPEYGATMGFFPPDQKSLEYLQMTGRDESKLAYIRVTDSIENLKLTLTFNRRI